MFILCLVPSPTGGKICGFIILIGTILFQGYGHEPITLILRFTLQKSSFEQKMSWKWASCEVKSIYSNKGKLLTAIVIYCTSKNVNSQLSFASFTWLYSNFLSFLLCCKMKDNLFNIKEIMRKAIFTAVFGYSDRSAKKVTVCM